MSNVLDYLEKLGTKLLSIEIKIDHHNVIFTDGKGGYIVKHFPLNEATFDELIERLEEFNKSSNSKGVRCLMVKTPSEFMTEYTEYDGVTMLTYCAPTKNAILDNYQMRSGALKDEFLIPDKRQVAADIIGNDPEMLPMARSALEGAKVRSSVTGEVVESRAFKR